MGQAREMVNRVTTTTTFSIPVMRCMRDKVQQRFWHGLLSDDGWTDTLYLHILVRVCSYIIRTCFKIVPTVFTTT